MTSTASSAAAAENLGVRTYSLTTTPGGDSRVTTTDATPVSGRTSTEDMLPGRPLIFTAAAKEVAATTT